MRGSRSRPRSAASASSRSSSARNRMGLVAASSPRSCPSSVMATGQPSPGAPTTRSAGVRAPVKNTSLKSLSPVSALIGLISMPGWSSGQSRNEIPRWPRARGSVRASRKIQLARCATEVQTFCPSITQSPPSSVGPGRQRREVRARPGLGETLAPPVLAGQDARQEPAPSAPACPTGAACCPSILMPKRSVCSPNGTPARASSSISTTWCSRDSPRPPYSGGQVMPSRPRRYSICRHCAANRSASWRPAMAPMPGQPGGSSCGQHGPHLGAEGFHLGGIADVHAVLPMRAPRVWRDRLGLASK